MPDQQPYGEPEREPKLEPRREPSHQPSAGAGEPDRGDGAAQPDYGMILEMIRDVQSNQSAIMGRLKSLSDAQSILVDSGAVVHEGNEPQSGVRAGFRNDGFIPLDKMDLSI